MHPEGDTDQPDAAAPVRPHPPTPREATDRSLLVRLRPAMAVGALAAGIRVLWTLFASRRPTGLSDPALYLDAAASIASGEGYRSLLGEPTAYYPPGYPYALGVLQWLLERVGAAEHLVFVIGIGQSLLGGVAAAAIVLIGRRLVVGGRAGWRTGVIAGVVFACWPNLVLHSPLVLSESLFLALVCLLLLALTELSHRWSTPMVALAVLSAAASTWVRPQSVLIVVPAVGLGWLWAGLGPRRALLGAATVAAGVVLAVLPWAARNAVVMDAFVPMSTNTGDNLCIGFHDGADGRFIITDACATEGRYVDGPRVEVDRDAQLRSRALRWIVDHPAELPRLSAAKLAATFGDDADGLAAWESYGADRHLSDGVRTTLRWISNLYYAVAALAALVGLAIVLGRQRSDPVALMLVLAGLGAAAVPVLFFGDPRFKVPVVPVLALLGAITIEQVVRRWEQR